jgi:hypothetical protein
MITLSQWLGYSTEKKLELIEKYSHECGLTYNQIKRLRNSLIVVDRFFIEAHKVAQKRDHYSARTIVEVLRHNSALEDGDKSFKINDHIISPLSRISMEMFPFLNNFFQTRNPTFKLEMQ